MALEGIGFVWNSYSAVWQEGMSELKEFRKSYVHCNVPTTYAATNKPKKVVQAVAFGRQGQQHNSYTDSQLGKH